MCAMTGLNIHTHVRDIASLVFLGDGVRRSGDWFVGCLEVRRSRGQYIENQPSPQPSPIGEGVNIGGQSGVSHEIDCHPELVSGSHKMQQHAGQSDVQKMLKRVQHDWNNFPKRTYSLINLFSYLPRKRCAFTLAEVLITLGIIGVVAAMTMPSLIANYQKKQTVTQLKKAYSTLSQALVAAQQEYGDMSGWEYSGMNLEAGDTNDALNNFVQKYLKPYIKIVQDCPVTDKNKCAYSFYSLGGVARSNGLASSNNYRFIINNGMVVNMAYDNNGVKFLDNIIFTVDLNGKKRPNMYGKDIFVLVFQPSYSKIKMYGEGQTLQTLLNANKGCNKNNSVFAGEYCGALIQYDGWEISDDYPW